MLCNNGKHYRKQWYNDNFSKKNNGITPLHGVTPGRHYTPRNTVQKIFKGKDYVCKVTTGKLW